jgi:hypothetical protein
VSDLPPEILNVTIRNFCIAVRRGAARAERPQATPNTNPYPRAERPQHPTLTLTLAQRGQKPHPTLTLYPRAERPQATPNTNPLPSRREAPSHTQHHNLNPRAERARAGGAAGGGARVSARALHRAPQPARAQRAPHRRRRLQTSGHRPGAPPHRAQPLPSPPLRSARKRGRVASLRG